MLKEQILALAAADTTPSISISIKSHRTHPDNLQDATVLKNLARQAHQQLLEQYDKRSISRLLDRLEQLAGEFDHQHNDEGLYIFLSNDVQETIKTKWPPAENRIYVDDHFALRDIIRAFNRSAHYYLLELSKSGSRLFEANDDRVLAEIKQEGFPFKDTQFYLTDQLAASDPKNVDNMVREFFNRLDKSVLKIHQDSPLPVIVATTTPNLSMLQSVADQPAIYAGHILTDPHNNSAHHLAETAWNVVQSLQQQERLLAVQEIQAAVPAGRVSTDLQEIFRAANEGRGELLLVAPDFSQPVIPSDEFLELSDHPGNPPVWDDVVNNIAWKVLEKKGRVYYTHQLPEDTFGPIALKLRY